MRCKATVTTVVSMGALLAFGSLGTVGAAERDNVVRFGATWVMPSGDLTVDGFFVEPVDEETRVEFQGDLTIEPDDAFGGSVSYERRFTDLIGVEVGYFGARHDVNGRVVGVLQLIRNADNVVLDEVSVDETDKIGDLTVTTWTAGANFHLTSSKAVDFYLGPYFAYVLYGDLEVEGETIPMENEFTFGAVAGIDVPFGESRWMFQASARYLRTQAEFSEPVQVGENTIRTDPFILQAGVAFRF